MLNWQDLPNYKKVREVKLDEEILFIMEEPTREEMDNLIEEMMKMGKEIKDNENIIDLMNKDENFLGKIIRLCAKDVQIGDLTDDQIVWTLNNMNPSVISQVNTYLYELVLQPLYAHLKFLKNSNEDFVDVMGVKDILKEKGIKEIKEAVN